MERPDNYAIQAKQVKARFLTYDQQALIRKLGLEADETYLYVTMLSEVYRICRADGGMERRTEKGWAEALARFATS